MNEHDDMLMIRDGAEVLRQAILSPDKGGLMLVGYGKRMQEKAMFVDLKRLQGVYDLLLQNLVNASDVMGEDNFMDAIVDTHREIIRYLNEMLPDVPEVATGETVVERLKLFQSLLNDPHTELLHTTNPAYRTQLIDALMFANIQLLDDPQNRDLMTQSRSLDYYLENITSSYYSLVIKH